MVDLTSTIVVLLVMGGSVYLSLRGRRKIERELRATFDRKTFDTPQGKVTGEALKVVKVSRQTVRFAADDVYQLAADPLPADTFWYCVGPGPSYFLAIAIVQVGYGKVDAEWVIRPLTEQRMRGALIGDRKATALAFGSAVEG
ncbi:hypothetical protein [Lysobacter panacisoli]|uniref:Uncharacterized protein n=1 Tax=Lysobacter panacisoli TaxID=1255263 RepID=A0ABP9L4M6_9GAMM|nr:hypothetical protein [Lysobacter panacisoli]